MAKRTQVEGVPVGVNRGGRPPALKVEHIALLRSIVSGMPHASLDELTAELEHRDAIRVCGATIRRTLRAQGIVRLMPQRKAFEESASRLLAKKRMAMPPPNDVIQACTTAPT